MELIMSAIAAIAAFVTVIVTIFIYQRGVEREKKQATLDAFNVLQEQVFDYLNQYTFREIRDICDTWNDSRKESEMSEDEKEHFKYAVSEYRKLSGYLARIEHFSLGVNTGIYDANIAERAGTKYLVMLYRGKLKPLIEVKHSGAGNTEYYGEFHKLVEKIEKIES